MHSEPLVSVVINNFNYGSYLAEAIQSALDQTYERLEVIVVDDGSTDGSADVIRSFGARVRGILKPNGGQASALNAGLAGCSGEIVCLLDSDDRWKATKVAQVVGTAVASGPGWSMLRHDLDLFGPGAPKEPTRILSLGGPLRRESVRPRDLLVKRRNVPTSALSFPREAFLRIGPIPADAFRISADAYLYTHLLRVGDVITLPASLGEYRVHANNNYFAGRRRADLQHWKRIFEIELALLQSLEPGTRWNDTLLYAAHQLERAALPTLGRLGPLPRRLRAIAGPWPVLGAPRRGRFLVRELVRSIRTRGGVS